MFTSSKLGKNNLCVPKLVLREHLGNTRNLSVKLTDILLLPHVYDQTIEMSITGSYPNEVHS